MNSRQRRTKTQKIIDCLPDLLITILATAIIFYLTCLFSFVSGSTLVFIGGCLFTILIFASFFTLVIDSYNY